MLVCVPTQGKAKQEAHYETRHGAYYHSIVEVFTGVEGRWESGRGGARVERLRLVEAGGAGHEVGLHVVGAVEHTCGRLRGRRGRTVGAGQRLGRVDAAAEGHTLAAHLLLRSLPIIRLLGGLLGRARGQARTRG